MMGRIRDEESRKVRDEAKVSKIFQTFLSISGFLGSRSS